MNACKRLAAGSIPSRFQSSQKPDFEKATHGGPPTSRSGRSPGANPPRAQNLSGRHPIVLSCSKRVQIGPYDLSKPREVRSCVLLHGVRGVGIPLDSDCSAEPGVLNTEIQSSCA